MATKKCNDKLDGITPTIYGIALQTAKWLNLPSQAVPFSTLNQKLEIQDGVEPPVGQTPAMRYLAIGIGGLNYTATTSGRTKITTAGHDYGDSGMYDQMPWVMRLTDNDLSVAERAKYALRKLETIEGKNYYSYWLKVISFAGTEIGMFQTTIENGESTTIPFIPNSSNLSPTPPVISPNESTETDGTYLSVIATHLLTFDANDAANFIEVCKIRTGDEELAIISEIGFVTGVPFRVTGAGGVQYDEALQAQIAIHVPTLQAVHQSRQGFDMRIEFGDAGPMATKGTYLATTSLPLSAVTFSPRL